MPYYHSLLAHIRQTMINIENCVGFVPVPVGLIGPLKIQGFEQTDDESFALLTTVEPTLATSCSRSCKAFDARGGLRFHVLREGMFGHPSSSSRTQEQRPHLPRGFLAFKPSLAKTPNRRADTCASKIPSLTSLDQTSTLNSATSTAMRLDITWLP